jgi:hypothetical protein
VEVFKNGSSSSLTDFMEGVERISERIAWIDKEQDRSISRIRETIQKKKQEKEKARKSVHTNEPKLAKGFSNFRKSERQCS